MSREEAFKRARNASIAELKRLEREAAGDVRRLLEEADREIAATLAAQPSDYRRWRLGELQPNLRRRLAEFGSEAAASAEGKAEAWWRAGVGAVDRPLAAGGVDLAAIFADPDPRQLLAVRTFLTRRITGIASEVADRVDRELGLVIAGVREPVQAIEEIRGRLEGGTGRALTVVRTELGRAYATANQERQLQAAEALPGLRKQWRRSGKLDSRVTHDLADGQIRKPDEPFDVGGEKLMHPRDPEASPKNTVNCGCVSLPYMDSWEVRQPGRQAFIQPELAGSESKRRIEELQRSEFVRWANGLSRGTVKPTGAWQGVGQIPVDVEAALSARGVAPVSREVALTDRALLHMLRDAKAARRAALPGREVRRLAEHIQQPKAVFYDREAKIPTLVYAFEVPGEERLGKLVVRLRETRRAERPRTHNRVATGGLVVRHQLEQAPRYELVYGSF